MQTPFLCDGNLAVYGHAAWVRYIFGSQGAKFLESVTHSQWNQYVFTPCPFCFCVYLMESNE